MEASICRPLSGITEATVHRPFSAIPEATVIRVLPVVPTQIPSIVRTNVTNTVNTTGSTSTGNAVAEVNYTAATVPSNHVLTAELSNILVPHYSPVVVSSTVPVYPSISTNQSYVYSLPANPVYAGVTISSPSSPPSSSSSLSSSSLFSAVDNTSYTDSTPVAVVLSETNGVGNANNASVASTIYDDKPRARASQSQLSYEDYERQREQRRSLPLTSRIAASISKSFYGAVNFSLDSDGVYSRKLLPYNIEIVEVDNKVLYIPYITLKQPCVDYGKSPQGNRPNSLKLGEYLSYEEAVECCLSCTPPIWSGSEDVSACVVCAFSFALMRSKHHCKNCGMYVCKSCSSKTWMSSCLPKTYYYNDGAVRVCDTCHNLSTRFAEALATGDLELVKNLYAIGNINLHKPLLFLESENYPIHFAALGGLNVMQWLVEQHFCKLFDDNGKELKNSMMQTALAIAASKGDDTTMQYLAVTCGCKVEEIECREVLVRGLHAALACPGNLPYEGTDSTIASVLKIKPACQRTPSRKATDRINSSLQTIIDASSRPDHPLVYADSTVITGHR